MGNADSGVGSSPERDKPGSSPASFHTSCMTLGKEYKNSLWFTFNVSVCLFVIFWVQVQDSGRHSNFKPQWYILLKEVRIY